MSVGVDTLPWSALKLHETVIPWDDLNALADAATSPDVRHRLMQELDQHLDARYQNHTECFNDFVDLAVSAVFAMAADRVDLEGRRDIAQYFIELLMRASDNDDDFLLEVVECAAGRLGTTLIDPAMGLIEKHGRKLHCWYHAWVLLGVARDATQELKQPVIDLCLRMLEILPDRYERYSAAMAPAWLLADIAPEQALTPIKALASRSKCLDIRHALRILEGEEPPPSPEFLYPWIAPIEQWLPRQLRIAREWLEEPDDGEPADDTYDDDEYCNSLESILHIMKDEPANTRFAADNDWQDIGLVQTPIARASRTVGRNEPCPCGSGRKFKKCCGRP